MFGKMKTVPLFITLFSILLSSFVYSGTTNYQYDDLHRLTKVERANGTVVLYEYDDLGNRISKNVTILITICDTNGDSKVDITDVVLSLQAACGIKATQQLYLASDVNDDGKIGIEEAIHAIRTAGGLIVPVGTVTSAGQVWMDRNLGASRVALSFDDEEAYGNLYQWGRGTDGHEKRTSPTVLTQISADVPGHSDFIKGSMNWLTTPNDQLWQGVSGTNNPCPAGFRLPTDTELDVERASWTSQDSAGAFASPLKLVIGGRRHYGTGSISNFGGMSGYWSSTVIGPYSRLLYFDNNNASVTSHYRANGSSVRCLRD